MIPGERENSEKQAAAIPQATTNGHSARGETNGASHSGQSYGERGSYGDRDRGERGDRGFDRGDRPKAGAMEVTVEHNIEKAMKILKRKLIKEGLFKELKSRRYYEKPSERRKRKHKESVKKIRKEESRAKKNSMLAS